jgi:hypothetical protein
MYASIQLVSLMLNTNFYPQRLQVLSTRNEYALPLADEIKITDCVFRGGVVGADRVVQNLSCSGQRNLLANSRNCETCDCRLLGQSTAVGG